MKIIFFESAEKELEKLDKPTNLLFGKHIEKIAFMPSHRHLKFGLPFNVEEVTKQARIVYKTEGETIYIIHCFSTHKEYEKWFKSFR
jgi:mRNA-degrading endonuclease RelE of RelBE toxin-antitoxin system